MAATTRRTLVVLILLLLVIAAITYLWYQSRPPTREEAFPRGEMLVGVENRVDDRLALRRQAQVPGSQEIHESLFRGLLAGQRHTATIFFMANQVNAGKWSAGVVARSD